MKNIFEIPLISFNSKDYDKSKNEIIINLNDYRFLDNLINEYQKSNRRIIPEINLLSPTGVMANFCFPCMDKWEIIFKGKKCNVRLIYK